MDTSSTKEARLNKTCDFIRSEFINVNCHIQNIQSENYSGLLDLICRGCSKEMIRLLSHLNSKKGKLCKEKYSDAEIEGHQRSTIKKKNFIYYRKKQEDICSHKKTYYKENREEILSSKKSNNQENGDKILSYKKSYYQKNRDKILSYKKCYNEELKEKMKYYKEANKNNKHDQMTIYKGGCNTVIIPGTETEEEDGDHMSDDPIEVSEFKINVVDNNMHKDDIKEKSGELMLMDGDINPEKCKKKLKNIKLLGEDRLVDKKRKSQGGTANSSCCSKISKSGYSGTKVLDIKEETEETMVFINEIEADNIKKEPEEFRTFGEELIVEPEESIHVYLAIPSEGELNTVYDIIDPDHECNCNNIDPCLKMKCFKCQH